jgi:hypothetical protein
MQETIYRQPHDRVLTMPLQTTGSGTCPHHKQVQQQQEQAELEESSRIRVRKSLSGTITGDIVVEQDVPENPEIRIRVDRRGTVVRVG